MKYDQLPPDVKAIWEQYRKEFKESYPIGDKADEVDHAFDLLTRRLANWYYDRDEFLGAPKPPKPGFAALAKKYQESKTRYEQLKNQPAAKAGRPTGAW